jgi:hypothetical protein
VGDVVFDKSGDPNQVQRVEVIPGLSDHDIVFTDLLLRQ